MEAQLRFDITSQTLRRLDNFVGCEGSTNFLHASFFIEDDNNIPNPYLTVYARYEGETYIVPKNEETGLFDIPGEVIQYPGFFISCRIGSGDDSSIQRYTEEVNVKIKGNGNILKRYMKADDRYSLEFLGMLYGQHAKNCENIKRLNESMQSLQEQIIKIAECVNNAGTQIQKTFEELGESLKFLNDVKYPMPIEPIIPVNPEDINEDKTGENDDVVEDTNNENTGSVQDNMQDVEQGSGDNIDEPIVEDNGTSDTNNEEETEITEGSEEGSETESKTPSEDISDVVEDSDEENLDEDLSGE